MLYSYDPAKVIVVYGGVPLSGFADGTFIQIEAADDDWTEVSGADGNVTRIRTNNSMSNVTVTLQQTSPANDILSAFRAVDLATAQGAKSLLVKDLLGSTKIFSGTTYIKKPATAAYGKEDANREWSLIAVDAVHYVGGSIPTI